MFSFDERVIPLDVWITNIVNWLVEGYRWFFQLIKWPVDFILSGVSDGLLATSPLLVIALFGAIAWRHCLASVRFKTGHLYAVIIGAHRSARFLVRNHDNPRNGLFIRGVLHSCWCAIWDMGWTQ